MSTWYVWGDYIHTMPRRIGPASMVDNEDRAARATADARGFDIERRIRNGFESWSATFSSDEGEDPEFSFASFPTVRGWEKV